MEFKFKTTGIGSAPYDNADYAVEKMMKLDVPYWPQMSKFGQLEQMETQYCEGIPCVVIDPVKNRMYLDTSIDYSEQFATFYENYMMALDPDDGNGDCSSMAISEPHSAGIYALERAVKKLGKKLPALKLQTIGPCSFGLSITDEGKRATFYNEEFKDVIVKAMTMKSVWQIQKFQPYCDQILCFVDEPVFAGFGSSTYVSVSREDVVRILTEVVDEVHKAGALAGCHCCGNTEWSILIDANYDIISFDSSGFGETIAVYPDHVKRHLEKGGAIAWGACPTSREIMDHTVESLEAKLEEMMDNLAQKAGIDKKLICEQAMLTPACGTGSITVEEADKVWELLGLLSARMKEKYGF